ncbi:MAG TPA: hypothetical protein VMM78_17965 [Thermomicrobiales bacterium]|nr:hypothetical protein [Thermomicrobiales bacterium]
MNDDRNRTDEHQLDRRLRQALEPRRVSGARRQHYRRLLSEHEEREMKRMRRHSRLELGAVAVVLLLIVVVSLWRLDVVGVDRDATPEPGIGAAPVETAVVEPSPARTEIAATDPACDVTPPSENGPSGFAGDPVYVNWYGDDGLWLSPVSVSGVNPSMPHSPYLWFTGGSPIWISADQEVQDISGRRTDGPSELLHVDKQLDVLTRQFPVRFVLTFPDAGCWELTATTADQELSIVIDVRPLEERPDMLVAHERHALLPYSPPDECAVTPMRGPVDDAGRFLPYYWIDGDGVSVRSHTGIVWAYEPTPFDWFLDEWGPIVVTGSSMANGAPLELEFDHIQRAGLDGQFWLSSVVFPVPGCWEIEATAGEQTLHAVLWVYPPECRREAGEDIPALCEIPD